MTTTDWIIDITLIVIVLRQVREARIDGHFVAIPAAIVAFTAHKYLHSIPTGGHDLVLIGACIAAGALLGLAGGLATHVRVADGHGYARAGLVAASLWIASMSARLGFILWITHASGEAALAHFSAAHDITGGAAWQDALVLLALSEVTVRLALIVLRTQILKSSSSNSEPSGTFPTEPATV